MSDANDDRRDQGRPGQRQPRQQPPQQPTQGGRPGPGRRSTLGPAVKRGLAVYLTVGLGTALTMFLLMVLAPGSGGPGMGFGGFMTGGQLSGSLLFGAFVVIGLGPLMAVGIGILATRWATPRESPALLAAAACGVGVAATALLLFLLGVLVLPAGGGAVIGQLVAPLVGGAVGVAVTGGAAAVMARQVDLL